MAVRCGHEHRGRRARVGDRPVKQRIANRLGSPAYDVKTASEQAKSDTDNSVRSWT